PGLRDGRHPTLLNRSRKFGFEGVRRNPESANRGTPRGPDMAERKHTSHMPPGFTAVTPYLTVDDPDRLVASVKEAFGAEDLEAQRVVGFVGKNADADFCLDGYLVYVSSAAGPRRDQ